MILETYKLSLSELKVTCSTTVYKNLSLIMRIGMTFDKEENRIYNVVNSTGLFDGQVLIKGKPIDTVAFELDTQRKKYLPKQIQFQLNLTYRTGKLNQKIYPINFNEFITKKKGHYEKEIKITQRLYSFYVVLVARSTTLDTIIQTPTLGSLARIKSQKRFDRQGLSPPQTEMKKRYSKYHSPQQQTVIKYTINQNIKITRPQQINSTSKLQPSLLNEQRQTSILREKFQQKQSQLSQMEEQKTRDQSSFIHRNRIFTSRGRQPITERLDQYPTKGIITAINNVGEKQKISVLQQKTSQLEQKLQQQQKRSYKLQKQLSSLKNKIEHLYHEKTILIREKQEERLVFQTKDKQQKMRQRRDIQQLRRVYEGQLKEKDERIGKMEKQLNQMRDVQSKRLQDMGNELKKHYQLIRQRQIQQSSKQISLLNNKIRQLQQKVEQTQRQLQEWVQKQKQPKLLTTPHHFVIHRQFLDEESLSQQLNYTQLSSSSFVTNEHDINTNKKQVNYIQGNNQRDQQQVGMNIDEISQQFLRQQELLELMEQQRLTYNNMIAKLQSNLLSVQRQFQLEVQKNQQLMKEIQRLNQHVGFYGQKQIQQRTIEEIKVVHDEQINQYERKIKDMQGEIETLSKNGKCIRDCHRHFHSCCCQVQDNQKGIDQNYCPCNCLSGDHHHHHQNSNCHAYHQIQIDHPQPQPQTIITVTTKQTTKYKITLYPQTQIIYIPASQFVKANNSKLLGQSSSSEGYYGKNFQLYQKNRQQLIGDNMNEQMYKTTGYFGRPLNRLVNIQNHNSSTKLDQNTEQSTYQNEQDQHQQYQVTNNNNFSCINNYSYISNKQQEQQQQYLNLIDQFQGINNKHTNISNISNKNIYISNNNRNISNNNDKKRSNSFYIGSQFFGHESDSIIVNKQEDSYINQNGDYVKKSLIEVYQRNRINSIS